MHQILATDRVELQKDLPELGLFRGDVGTVVSTWFYPNAAYEVEFEPSSELCARRVLLLQEQVRPMHAQLAAAN